MIEDFDTNVSNVIKWANEKGIISADNAKKQVSKFVEEAEEMIAEIEDGNLELAKMEMGDVFVTLITTAACLGFTPAEALDLAYNKISKRKGSVVNGIFVKEADLHG